jgi:hypothetical protein
MMAALAILIGGTWAVHSEAEQSDVAVTIYSAPSKAGRGQRDMAVQQMAQGEFYGQRRYGGFSAGAGFGVVKEMRTIDLLEGITRYRFSNVAAKLDPTTVKFRSLTEPKVTAVLEQNFEYDLVTPAKLMDKYIDRKIAFEPAPGEKGKTIEGILLSNQGGRMIQLSDGAVHINPPGNVVLPNLPGGLISKPTLEWQIRSPKAGPQQVEVAYQTEGLSWESAYTTVLGADEKTMDLSAWVTVANRSGATYRDARLKLVAGDVHRVEPPQAQMRQTGYGMLSEALAQEQEQRGFEEKGFFEYHLYTLGRRSTISDNSIKQIEMFEPVTGVPVEKVFVYYGFVPTPFYANQPDRNRSLGTRCNTDVDIYLKFKNEKARRLGMPLPAGRVRLFKRDPADKQMELIGEDWIDHTPKDEEVLLRLGSAFDLRGERKQTGFQVDERAHWMRESFEITLRNHKKEEARVIVKENLYRWAQWEIEKASHPFEKKDARTIQFNVTVPPNGEQRLTYTAHYSW